MPDDTATAGAMARRRIAIIECDHVIPELRHVAGDYGDMFEARFGAEAPELALIRLDVVGGEPVPEVGAFDGYLLTGSKHSVNDPMPWLDDLRRLLVDTHAHGVPVVGICFGHQLIAQALGGRVERAPQGWGVGVHAARVVAQAPWMDPEAAEVRLLVSHQDQVTELPAAAEVLAVSDHAPIAAFHVGSLVGFQGHPEFVADYAAALLDRRVEMIGAATVDAARATLATPTDHTTVVRWAARHFVTGSST